MDLTRESFRERCKHQAKHSVFFHTTDPLFFLFVFFYFENSSCRGEKKEKAKRLKETKITQSSESEKRCERLLRLHEVPLYPGAHTHVPSAGEQEPPF